MAKRKSYGRTASGKPITDELVERLADKAEAGYWIPVLPCMRAKRALL